MMRLKVFVVDDQEIMRITLADELNDAGFKAYEFSNAEEAVNSIELLKPDVVLSDIRMPGKSGLDLLEYVHKHHDNIRVILMTSYGSIQSAVDAMKSGAYDYITKPFVTQDLIIRLERIQEFNYLSNFVESNSRQRQEEFDYSSFVGNSNSVEETFMLLDKVINTDASILILGETGTGKELLTSIIHYNSNRSKRPFVKVSCAVLSREIFESELFGHEKGAFTGATALKKGRFELADTGTIYLDDVDDIPLDLQVKLLRVLEQREFERVGSSESSKIDVRVIASTKADLRKLVDEGKFREDLFYRLNVFPVTIKPLRERKGDIAKLAGYFAVKFAGKNAEISENIIDKFMQYDWPGNARELRNTIERLSILSGPEITDISLLPKEILPGIKNTSHNLELAQDESLDEILSDIEMKYLIKALDKSDGNKTNAAKLLGIPLSTLRTKLEKYNLG